MSQQPWEFNPQLDTTKSLEAFSLFLNLGHKRTLAAAYRLYKGRSEDGLKTARYFERWSAQGQWVARAEAWDRHLQRQAIAKHEDAAQNLLEKSLADLSQQSSRLGQVQLGLVTRAASIANREFKLWEAELDGIPIDRPPRYQDAIAILRTLPALRSDGHDAWSKALYVDKLLADMEARNIAENDVPEGIQWTRYVEPFDYNEHMNLED
jgi:hypothetical protein